VLVERMSAAPRRLLGLEVPDIIAGAEINAVLFDPAAVTMVDKNFIKSRSVNTPFLGRELAGRIEFVAVGDRVRALEVYELAIELLEQRPASRHTLTAYREYSSLLKEEGKSDRALEVLERALALQDQVGRVLT